MIYGLIACAIAYFLIQRTTFGFAARTVGGNIRAARLAGLPVGKLTLIICFLAGSCAGLAGIVEVAAIHGRANESLNANYGYGGILVAFIARQKPPSGGSYFHPIRGDFNQWRNLTTGSFSARCDSVTLPRISLFGRAV